MAMTNSYLSQGFAVEKGSSQSRRQQSEYSPQIAREEGVRHDLMLKNLYREQLDDIMKQKEEQKRYQREQSNQERQVYNERINFNKQAERLKDLSYKNYYNLLLNNQTHIGRNHPVLNQQREKEKQSLVAQGIQTERLRSQRAWEAEQKRLQDQRSAYKQELDREMAHKNFKNSQEHQDKLKQQQAYKNIAFTPHEVAKLQRDRKLMQMSKYKQDLQRSSPYIGEKSRIATTGNQIVGKSSNDFNIHSQISHNPMVNPLPYNIQNPYILREFMRRAQNAAPRSDDSLSL